MTIQEGCVYSRFSECAQDPDTKVLILTGADPYYCAGVDLSATIKPMHPKYVKSFPDDLYQSSVLLVFRKLHNMIRESNQAVFDSFLDFPKPILIAANGPAIGKYLDDRDDDDINGHDPGACVTSASTCDAIIASEKVTLKNNVFA